MIQEQKQINVENFSDEYALMFPNLLIHPVTGKEWLRKG